MATLWLPTGLLLDQDIIKRLYTFHQPPDTDQSQFSEYARTLPRDDLQELIEPWIESLSGDNTQASYIVKAHSIFLRNTDVDDLWDDVACQDDWEADDFQAFIESAPPEEIIDFLVSVAEAPDLKHLSRRAKLMLSSRGGRNCLPLFVCMYFFAN
jgi:hypothetical protein